jgi:hypothetical protein
MLTYADVYAAEAHVYLHSTLFILAHDSDESISSKAKELLAKYALTEASLDWLQLVECLSHEHAQVRCSIREHTQLVELQHTSAYAAR